MSDDIIREFLIESNEGLDRLDAAFTDLEVRPDDMNLIAEVFRVIHTIKGTSGFFGFSKLESLAHSGESLLGKLRDGALTLTPERTSALLSLVDASRELLRTVEEHGVEGSSNYSDLAARLCALQHDMPATEGPAPFPLPNDPPSSSQPELILIPAIAALTAHEEDQQASPKLDAAVPPSDSTGAIVNSNIRVDVGLLDRLMNLVGELVLARNQLLQSSASSRDAAFSIVAQRLNIITTELQESVMKTRMQPIGNVWNKLPRVVRDVALACGKEARVQFEGADTELDKTIIEAIKDPITHLIRNAVDHGIEAPELREVQGKTRQGTITLRAYHENGQVNVEISDDGKGLDLEAIRRKALERRVIAANQASEMTDRELANLIFAPGFSTATTVTNVSGRGVGMDVVKTNVERIGGTVDVVSSAGAGTTIRLRIPLTLAIIPALIVTSGALRFAIPQINMVELVHLSDHHSAAIELVQGAPVYRLRGNLLPLLYLDQELRIASNRPDDSIRNVNIAVLQTDDAQFGLVVDDISDTEEIVVKPLGKELASLSCYAGATIMGNGEVALIIDVAGLASSSSLKRKNQSARAAHAKEAHSTAGQTASWLIFEDANHRRCAMPLNHVARLEEISPSMIEHSEGVEVVQYRGEIMPLVHVGSSCGSGDPDHPLKVVVHSQHGHSIGLVVDQVIDIVDTERFSAESGRSAVIQGRVSEIVSAQEIIQRTCLGFSTGAVEEACQ